MAPAPSNWQAKEDSTRKPASSASAVGEEGNESTPTTKMRSFHRHRRRHRRGLPLRAPAYTWRSPGTPAFGPTFASCPRWMHPLASAPRTGQSATPADSPRPTESESGGGGRRVEGEWSKRNQIMMDDETFFYVGLPFSVPCAVSRCDSTACRWISRAWSSVEMRRASSFAWS